MKDNTKRTFPEIWAALDRRTRREIYERALIEIHCADVTFRNWAHGRRVPKAYPTAKALASILAEVAGISVNPEELFPNIL